MINYKFGMKYFILLIFGVFLFSCSASKSTDLSVVGTFRGDSSQEFIAFDKDSTFLMESFSEFTDTLSFGVWKVENGFIKVTSDNSIFEEYFPVSVEESFSGLKDSLYISIENKLDGLVDYDGIFEPYLYFNVDRYFTDKGFKESEQFIETISVSNIKPILEFNINIIPNLYVYPEKISGKALKTIPYRPKSSKSNTFKIKILNFDKKYFAYRQLMEDYIKILDKNTLYWNGEKFVRQK